jgi:hypothetical protein
MTLRANKFRTRKICIRRVWRQEEEDAETLDTGGGAEDAGITSPEMRLLLPLAASGILGSAVSCGPKEAMDPSDIIAEDPAFLPPDPTRSEREARVSREPMATRRDCEAAARHLEELGLDLAAREAETPEERERIRAETREVLESAPVRGRIARAADECLERGTPVREAGCVSRVRSEQEIDRCTR